MNIEQVILSQLIYNEDFTRKTIPFLKEEYFADYNYKVIYELISSYINKYNNLPTKESLLIDLDNKNNLNEDTYKTCRDFISKLDKPDKSDISWLLDKTEKFCQEKSIYNAIMESINILNDKNHKKTKESIPSILSDALAVSFDTNIGHDFLDDFENRYNFYHTKEVKIQFDLDYFNKITKGGLSRKTLSIISAGTGTGKSLFMCHCASANLLSGLNVLYITLEMAEEKIAERIDANLLNIKLDDLSTISKEIYNKKIERVRNKTKGKLIIKEYPTACAGSANFRHLINELRIKKNFIPDIIYIDYLNICISSRLKSNNNINSYTYIKAISEELRGLAVEYNVPIITATQVNRKGYMDSDFGLEDTSESFGLTFIADFMFALISNDDLHEMGQILVKQLKNRYSDPNQYKKFVIGVDRSMMKLYDVEQSAQEDITDGPIMDNTNFGKEDFERSKPKSKFDKRKLEGFK